MIVNAIAIEKSIAYGVPEQEAWLAGELKRSVNAVLQMMDGYRGPSILIATTNYETLLDKAVWRRFDEVIHFEPPNLEQAKRLLAMAEKGQDLGVKTRLEVDDALLNLRAAEANLARARRDYLVALTNLGYVQGTL